jgi:protocatechuate 3,4-dioxygenase beta subunit
MKRNLILFNLILILTLSGSLMAFTIQGHVFNQADSTAITGAQVELCGMDGHQTVTDESGLFTFENVQGGNVRLSVHAEDFEHFEQMLQVNADLQIECPLVAEGGHGGNPGDPEDPGTLSLTGIVTDVVSGVILPNLTVVLDGWGQGWGGHGGEAEELTATTDETGAYSFTELNAGNYQIHIEAEGYREFTNMVQLEESATLDIAMQPFATGDLTLSGTITSSETGEILPGIFVLLHGEHSHFGVMTNDAGQYAFEGLAAGEYHLSIRSECPGQPLYNETITLTESTILDIAIGAVADTYVTLSGVVTDSTTGTPLAGVMVNLFRAPMHGYFGGEVTTDENGAYSFAQVQDGTTAHVIAHLQGYEPFMQDVDVNGDTTLDITLPPREAEAVGTITGTVVDDSTGVPVEGAMIHLVRVDQGGGHHGAHFCGAMTDADGNYSLQAPAGLYYAVCITGQMPGGYMEFFDNAMNIETATQLDVVENVTLEHIDFGVPANPVDSGAAGSYVTGLITDSYGNPINEATIIVRDVDGNTVGTVSTDETGLYAVDDLISGDTYTIVAQESGCTSMTADFTHEGLVSVVSMSLLDVTSNNDTNAPAQVLITRNEPNPFNPETSIRMNLPATAGVKLTIYNARGQQIRTLVNGELIAGEHSVTWNGTDNHGQAVSSGLYFYRLETGNQNVVRKMTLMK